MSDYQQPENVASNFTPPQMAKPFLYLTLWARSIRWVAESLSVKVRS